MRFFPDTDFLAQFKCGAVFKTELGNLEIESFKNNLIRFKNYSTKETSAKLTNLSLYSSTQETKEKIKLQKDEFFWFDIIGLNVFENGVEIGVVKDIVRLYVDHLEILLKTPKKQKTILIAYIDRYIQNVDLEHKKLYVKNVQILINSL